MEKVTTMKLRRCAHLVIEPRETAEFDLESLATGGDGVRRRFAWVALIPWRAEEVELSDAEVAALPLLSESQWRERSLIEAKVGAGVVDHLLRHGLVQADDEAGRADRERDQIVRDQYWSTLSAVSHYFGRWTGIDDDPELRPPGYDSMRSLIAKLGDPPSSVHACVRTEARIPLPPSERTELDALWSSRVTCRNFDPERATTSVDLARILAAVFGIQGRHGEGTAEEVLKKNHPSGGALHPLEAYVLVQRVEGLAPGLYHFHAGSHALEPLPGVADLDAFARACTSGQRYLANAPVLVAMTVRFSRCFWKYRRHAKAYRTLLLEAGHASQNLYLAATERGLGAFITAAINEVEIEQGFGLDPLQEGVLAVSGFGYRGAHQQTPEFDPNEAVWGAF
jgi:putative peptide maturation dehydrogenase